MADKNPSEHTYLNSIQLNGNDAYAGSSTAGGIAHGTSQYKVHVAGHFNQPFQTSALWQDDSIDPARKSAEGKHTGAWLDFGKAHEVVLKVGISFASQQGAEANLEKRFPGGASIRFTHRLAPPGARFSIASPSKAALKISEPSSQPASTTPFSRPISSATKTATTPGSMARSTPSLVQSKPRSTPISLTGISTATPSNSTQCLNLSALPT